MSSIEESPPALVDEVNRYLLDDDPTAAAQVLAQAGIDALIALDLADLRALMVRIGHPVDETPHALLGYARVLELSLHREERAEVLGHLEELAISRGDESLHRAVRAERARDHVRDWNAEEAIRLADSLLPHVRGPDEVGTRIRLLQALGGAHSLRREAGDVSRAAEMLRESAALARQVGVRTWEAHALAWLGYNTLYPEGDDVEAIAALKRALETAIPGSGLVSIVRVCLATVLQGAGHLDEAVTHLQAMEDEARARADARGLAWASWAWSRQAAYRNDAMQLASYLDEVERHRTEWFDDPEGLEFLAEASELAQSFGDEPMARRYLEQAEVRARADGLEHMVRPARAAFEARFGDPTLAAELLDIKPTYPSALRRNRWLVEVLRAIAADRRGELVEARRLAASAIDQASTMGLAHLLPIREPVLAPRVLEMAIAGGSAAARELAATRSPQVRVTLFGRFHVRVGSEDMTPSGQPATLVKLVALSGGSIPADRVIEALWPDASLDAGRRRLRNLLNRLRSMSGPLVVREGDLLRIPDAAIDLMAVEAALDRLAGWAPDGPDTMREAWTLITGPLLADDPYEEWAMESRERLTRRLVGAADRMAADAERVGKESEAVLWLEHAVDLDPLDLERHHALVAAATRSGDRSGLRWAASRAIAAYRNLEIEPPAELLELQIGGSSR